MEIPKKLDPSVLDTLRIVVPPRYIHCHDVRQAFRYELDPNNRQRTLLAKHAGVARCAYNVRHGVRWGKEVIAEHLNAAINLEKYVAVSSTETENACGGESSGQDGNVLVKLAPARQRRKFTLSEAGTGQRSRERFA